MERERERWMGREKDGERERPTLKVTRGEWERTMRADRVRWRVEHRKKERGTDRLGRRHVSYKINRLDQEILVNGK